MATKRNRRTPEQLIADLEAKIEAVKARAKRREMKQSGATRHLLIALRAIDKGLEAAAREKNGALKAVLAEGREPLAAYVILEGLHDPGRRRRRRSME